MARKLGDVLHLLLGEDGPAARARAAPAAGVAPSALVACIGPSADVLGLSAAWNLAAAHATLAGPTVWMASRCASCGPGVSLPPAFRHVEASLVDLPRAVADARPASIWLHLARAAESRSEWLARTLHCVAPGPDGIAQCLARMEEVRARTPASELFALILGADSRAAAAERSSSLRQWAAARFAGGLAWSGILPDEASLYRSWITRQPLCVETVDSGDPVALFDAVRAISRGPDPVAANHA